MKVEGLQVHIVLLKQIQVFFFFEKKPVILKLTKLCQECVSQLFSCSVVPTVRCMIYV